MTPKKLAIFASGKGSNAIAIDEYFKANPAFGLVSLIVSNKKNAPVLAWAKEKNLPTLLLEKDLFFNSNIYIDCLKEKGIDWIILAGFLWKIPPVFIAAFPFRIINIHPALLPKYGGAGMYGMRIHEKVVANQEIESGITIHYVDEIYDNGKIIFQAQCPIFYTDTPAMVAEKIHQLEHQHYPLVIEKLLKEEN